MRADDENEGSFGGSLRDALGFAYRHSLVLVVISVCWVVSSLPVVTCGISTLGAYSAIRSLRSNKKVKFSEITATIRRHGVNASLLIYVPIIIGFATATYFLTYVRTDSFRYLAIAIAGTYLFIFLSLVVLTTFAVLSRDRSFVGSLSTGYTWVVGNPTHSTTLIFVYAGLLLLGAVSVIGLVIIVPALLFTLHEGVVRDGTLHSPSKA
ncbi:hypothetical protein C447_11185 [Halococcus hamelinensis 100A6]|uniref:DUF624 domain-containing protein n=1 Tax=Halococcus hamelinensis 100A6 TaxID=1132509 RepID=M0LX36_9EURY|nr:hypothetical protein [Halococcus hamelinensis]EMA37996.1 hypothetical protein C447_11185 [Halococcus hamelinensis 100A6]